MSRERGGVVYKVVDEWVCRMTMVGVRLCTDAEVRTDAETSSAATARRCLRLLFQKTSWYQQTSKRRVLFKSISLIPSYHLPIPPLLLVNQGENCEKNTYTNKE